MLKTISVFVIACTLFTALYKVHLCYTQSQEVDVQNLWSQWKTQYGKTYNDVEESQRFQIFINNYELIQDHNSQPHTFYMVINKFADLEPEEFSSIYASCSPTKGGFNDEYCPSAVNCPVFPQKKITTMNWTQSGAVTPVKNQEQCGSCWAFSTTGALEGLYYLNHSLLLSFSEQQIVDCDTQCYGCMGCWPYMAMNYTAQYGIELEKIYPYVGYQTTCKYNADLALKVNTGYQCIAQKSASQMMSALAQQPVSIGVEADQAAWQFYGGGVVTDNCGASLDHAVLLTGIGNYEGNSAYYVKNSWGADWGMNGYIWLGTDASQNEGYGVCGILRCGTIPVNS